MDLNVQGGTLSDGVNIQANAAIAATAQLSVETTMIGGSDTVSVGYAGKLAGGLSIQEKAGNGWDWQDDRHQPRRGKHRVGAGPRARRGRGRSAHPDGPGRGQSFEEPEGVDQHRHGIHAVVKTSNVTVST